MQLLRRFHDLIFADSLDSLAAVPNISIGGWGGWNYAVGSSMLLENAGGKDISAYCILDSDYHTPKEIEARQVNAQAKKVRLHVWRRKEIENYLVIPAVLQRVIASSCSNPPSVEEILEKVFEIAETNRDEVYDNFAESFLLEDKSKGTKVANARARAFLAPIWSNPQEFHHRVSGKTMLSTLSGWSKDRFGVSFGVAAILRMLRREDLIPEIVAVISAIQSNEPFSAEN
jgi:hypothetical protein